MITSKAANHPLIYPQRNRKIAIVLVHTRLECPSSSTSVHSFLPSFIRSVARLLARLSSDLTQPLETTSRVLTSNERACVRVCVCVRLCVMLSWLADASQLLWFLGRTAVFVTYLLLLSILSPVQTLLSLKLRLQVLLYDTLQAIGSPLGLTDSAAPSAASSRSSSASRLHGNGTDTEDDLSDMSSGGEESADSEPEHGSLARRLARDKTAKQATAGAASSRDAPALERGSNGTGSTPSLLWRLSSAIARALRLDKLFPDVAKMLSMEVQRGC